MRISDWSSDVCSSDLVTSQRGASGGYVLSAAPDNITVAQIIQAMEGPIALTACVDGATDCCGAEAYCPMRGNWNRVNDAFRQALSSVSLAEMMVLPGFGLPRQIGQKVGPGADDDVRTQSRQQRSVRREDQTTDFATAGEHLNDRNATE